MFGIGGQIVHPRPCGSTGIDVSRVNKSQKELCGLHLRLLAAGQSGLCHAGSSAIWTLSVLHILRRIKKQRIALRFREAAQLDDAYEGKSRRSDDRFCGPQGYSVAPLAFCRIQRLVGRSQNINHCRTMLRE